MNGDIPTVILGMFIGVWCVSILVSAWIYVPYYRRLLHRLDPAEYQRTGGWTFFSAVHSMNVAAYFLKREYVRVDDERLQRHGRILRWTFSIPLLAAAVALPIALIVETVRKR